MPTPTARPSPAAAPAAGPGRRARLRADRTGPADRRRAGGDGPGWRLPAAASVGWGALVAAGLVVGTDRIAGRDEMALRAAPLAGHWDRHVAPGLLVAAAVAVLVVAYGPRVAAAARWRVVVALASATTVAWATALAATRGWDAVAAPVATRFEYLAVVGRIDGPGEFLRTYTERLGDYPTHVKGHPPGMAVALWALDRLHLQGPGWAAALFLAGAGLATGATLVAVRSVAGDGIARRAAPFVALSPAALWLATSADAVFAGVAALGVALLARRRPPPPTANGMPTADAADATGSTGSTGEGTPPTRGGGGAPATSVVFAAGPGSTGDGPVHGSGPDAAHERDGAHPTRPAQPADRAGGRDAEGGAYGTGGGRGGRRVDLAHVAGGGVLALGLFASYGLAAFLAVPAGVAAVRRDGRAVLCAVGGASAVTAAWALAGFWWFDGLDATRAFYDAGVARDRPYGIFTALLNPAALALATGPALAAGLALTARDAARRPWPAGRWVLPAAALAAVVAADLSGLSKGEVERIWLPFVPWLLVATAALPRPRPWLAAQAAVALALQAALDSPW